MTTDWFAYLRAQGASEGEIALIDSSRWLVQMVLEYTILPGRRLLDVDTVAGNAKADPQIAEAMWRSMGFPPVEEGRAVFTEADAAALVNALEDVHSYSDFERAVQTTRALSGAMAKVAEIFTDNLERTTRELVLGGANDAEVATQLVAMMNFDEIMPPLEYMLRRQLVASVQRRVDWRKSPIAADGVPLAIGFADLVGYTSLTQGLSGDELSELVNRFEAVTSDVISEHGGRLVKTIGDEVMYVAGDAFTAVEIALALVEEHEADELLPQVKVAFDFGPVISRDGDYFGSVVNRANRLVDVARAGTVVTTAEGRRMLLHSPDGIALDASIHLSALGTKSLKGLDPTVVWRVERVATP